MGMVERTPYTELRMPTGPLKPVEWKLEWAVALEAVEESLISTGQDAGLRRGGATLRRRLTLPARELLRRPHECLTEHAVSCSETRRFMTRPLGLHLDECRMLEQEDIGMGLQSGLR